jgi:hypothetical protein
MTIRTVLLKLLMQLQRKETFKLKGSNLTGVEDLSMRLSKVNGSVVKA